MKQLGLLILVLALAALACGGGGGDKLACVKVAVDVCDGWESKGTATNICSEKINGAEVYLNTIDASGRVIDRDAEYVGSLAPGGHAYLEWVLSPDDPEVASCRAEVTEAY